MTNLTKARVDPSRLMTSDFVLVCATGGLVFFAAHLLLPTLPLYLLHLGGHEGDIGLVIGSFYISTLLIRPWSGKWSEKIGPVRVLRMATGLSLLSVIAYNFAGTILFVVLVRVMHGFGYGTFGTSSNSAVAYLAPVSRRGEALGIFMMTTIVPLAIGPAIGIGLVSSFGFGALFIAVTIIYLASFVMSQFIDRRNQYVPQSNNTSKLINTKVLLPGFVGLTTYYTYGLLASYLAPYAVKKGLENPGLFFGGYAVFALVVRLFAGKVSDRLGRMAVLIPSLLTVALSMFVLAFSSNSWSILVAAILYGLGAGAVYPVLIALSVDMVGPDERSSAVSTYYASSDIGQILGGMLSATLVVTVSMEAAWLAAGTLVLSGLAALIIFGRRFRRENEMGLA